MGGERKNQWKWLNWVQIVEIVVFKIILVYFSFLVFWLKKKVFQQKYIDKYNSYELSMYVHTIDGCIAIHSILSRRRTYV